MPLTEWDREAATYGPGEMEGDGDSLALAIDPDVSAEIIAESLAGMAADLGCELRAYSTELDEIPW